MVAISSPRAAAKPASKAALNVFVADDDVRFLEGLRPLDDARALGTLVRLVRRHRLQLLGLAVGAVAARQAPAGPPPTLATTSPTPSF